jgi:SRSO17 transposase
VEFLNLQQILHAHSLNHCRERMAEYAERYGNLFSRADQREWFRLYVRGLLTAPERKNVETIAAAVASEIQTGANLAQALQHFVSQSPWEHSRVFARYRECLSPVYRDQASAWIIHDGVLLKKGRNSVGTQRQMARPIKRKVNCQIAVVVGVTGNAGYVPLATRLYLPRYWLRENAPLVDKTVPHHLHQYVPKQAIGLSLIEELRGEGWTAPKAVVEEGYRIASGFVEAMAERGIRVVEDELNSLRVAGERFDWFKSRLGMDHFEGRTWTGWHHHAAMVFAAAGFLFSGPGESVD